MGFRPDVGCRGLTGRPLRGCRRIGSFNDYNTTVFHIVLVVFYYFTRDLPTACGFSQGALDKLIIRHGNQAWRQPAGSQLEASSNGQRQEMSFMCHATDAVQVGQIPSPYLPTRLYAFRPFGIHVNGDPTQRRKFIARLCPDLPTTMLVANWGVKSANVQRA